MTKKTRKTTKTRCTRCKKYIVTIDKFPIPRLNTKPYCTNCYERVKYIRKCKVFSEKIRNQESKYDLCPVCKTNKKLIGSHKCKNCLKKYNLSLLGQEIKQ